MHVVINSTTVLSLNVKHIIEVFFFYRALFPYDSFFFATSTSSFIKWIPYESSKFQPREENILSNYTKNIFKIYYDRSCNFLTPQSLLKHAFLSLWSITFFNVFKILFILFLSDIFLLSYLFRELISFLLSSSS